MPSCPACGAELRPSARFCGQCGAGSAAPEQGPGTCGRCGRALRRGALFCGGCGAATADAVPPISQPSEGAVVFIANEGQRASLESALPDALWIRAEDAVERAQQHLRTLERQRRGVTSVCLVGDADAVPFGALDDPCGYDEQLLTDAVYGMLETPAASDRLAGDVLPLVPVTRIPTSDLSVVRRLLANHRNLSGSWNNGVCVSASVWSRATESVMEALEPGVAVQLSPPAKRSEVGALLQRGPGRMLFNVHGTDQDNVWLGEGDGRYPEVLRPPDVVAADAAVVVSEACYGATLLDGDDSLAPTFLHKGADLFVGSTIIAWGGGPGAPPTLADELALLVFRGLDAGLPGAQALHHARIQLLEQALHSSTGLTAPLHNTLLSFVAYGSPHATCVPRSRHRAPRPRSPSHALRDARERLRQRISPTHWRVLSAGRTTLAALSQRYRSGASVWNTMHRLLEGEPDATRLIAYGDGQERAATLLGESKRSGRTWRAGIDLDSTGNIVRSYVARQ